MPDGCSGMETGNHLLCRFEQIGYDGNQVNEIRELFESVDSPQGIVDYPSLMFAEFQLQAHEHNATAMLQVP